MKNSHIQITFEDDSVTVTKELETSIFENLQFLLKKTGNQGKILSLFFCTSETVKSLNKTYRDKDQVTDILSWLYDDNEIEGPCKEEPWGELAICLDVCKRQAEEAGLTLKTELLRLLVHGLAHLMGYDHEISLEEEKEMLKFEMDLLSSINLDGIYK
ncbi:rRNA maturation RNase YbeY [bacterium]|nr:rRNA maturation RNase YbeY [bacterium]